MQKEQNSTWWFVIVASVAVLFGWPKLFLPSFLMLKSTNEIRASHTVFPSSAISSGSNLAQIYCEHILIRLIEWDEMITWVFQ